jgi:hypothetical protein
VKGRRRRRRDAGRRREKKGRERVDAQAVRGAAGLRCNFQRAEGLFAKLTGGGAGASAARHVDREMRGAKETAVAFHFSDLQGMHATDKSIFSHSHIGAEAVHASSSSASLSLQCAVSQSLIITARCQQLLEGLDRVHWCHATSCYSIRPRLQNSKFCYELICQGCGCC